MNDYINRLENNDPTLVELDLWNGKNIDNARFVKSLKNNTCLQYLKIYYNKNYFNVNYIVEILKHNIGIQELNIYNMSNISENDVKKIINSLKVNITLRILYISIGNINDSNAIEITNMLKINTTLQKLFIYFSDISELGLIEIVNALRINTSLKVLDVIGNYIINDEVRDEIIDILQYNYTLEKLIGVYFDDFFSSENRSIRKRFLTTKCAKKN